MKSISIQSETGNSEIFIGETLSNVSKYLPEGNKIALITDSRIKEIYGLQFPKADLLIEIPEGEKNKSLQTTESVLEKLAQAEFDRTSFILGIGGGIVCDVAGFAASVFMRGIKFGFVSTTLLSQVDASVGGKNGVNFRGYKNLIGTFNQPEFVICDLEMLKTLPQGELINGMAEVVKHGVIADAALFDFIEKNTESILNYNTNDLERLVCDSVVLKSGIVNKDAKETGLRRILNFGHTFGHAIEKNISISHGMAVSIGMVIAAKISVVRGYISKTEADRIVSLLNKLGLPTDLTIDAKILLEAIKRDKKREGDEINFVFLKKTGSAVVDKVTFTELESMCNDLY